MIGVFFFSGTFSWEFTTSCDFSGNEWEYMGI